MTFAAPMLILLTAPIPPDLMMLQDSLESRYENVYMELYSCPIPSVDHYGVCEREWLAEDPLAVDDWFVIGDTLISTEINPSMFLFSPECGEEASAAAAWLASVTWGQCSVLHVDATADSSGYTVNVSLMVYDSPQMFGDADSARVDLVYAVTGDRWRLETTSEE